MKNKEELQDFLIELNQSNKLIIVEGPKDQKALRDAGVHNPIIELTKKPIFEIVENVAKISDEAIILTDFDKKGKELYGKLNSDLQKNGVKVDHFFREWLQKNTKLSHIEGLTKYISNL